MRDSQLPGQLMERLLEYTSHHPFLVSLAVAMALAVLAFELRQRGHNYSSITAQDAIRLMNGGAAMIDLRSKEAFDAGHVNGARHFAPEQVANAAEALKRYREKPVVLCCESGVSAARVARQLQASGFTRVVNLRGGITAWRAEGLPLKRN